MSLTLLTGVIILLFILSSNNDYDNKYLYLCPFICACGVYAIKLVSQLKMNMFHVSTFAISTIGLVFGILTDIVLSLIYVFDWEKVTDDKFELVALKIIPAPIVCLSFHLIQELLLVFQYCYLYSERRSDTLKTKEHLFVIDLE